MIRAVVVASMVLVGGHARAGSVLDLSAPQQGPFPSFLDLNDGKPSSWGETRPRRETANEPVAAVPASMMAPLPLSSMVKPAQATPSASGSRTLIVINNSRRETVRPQSPSRGFGIGRRRR